MELAGAANHWGELCRSLAVEGEAVGLVWDEMAVAYAEPWRHYHKMAHIASMLALRMEHAAMFRDPATTDLAIFMHDVVYLPQRGNNEAASAVWARERLGQLGIVRDRIATVAHFIEMSRHDTSSLAAVDPASDLALFLDLDLSVLAAEPTAYEAYSRAIRAEYDIYSDLLYRRGRANVLKGFLQRPALYTSSYFAPLWEAAARANITRELATLAP